jgi:hypothetical protein
VVGRGRREGPLPDPARLQPTPQSEGRRARPFFRTLRRVQVGGVTKDRRGIVRDPFDRARLAQSLFLYTFRPAHDIGVSAALSWIGGKDAREQFQFTHNLRKSCVCLARYMRQSMDWVESLTLDEFNRWGDVLAEVLIEERGGTPDKETADPFGLLRSDD